MTIAAHTEPTIIHVTPAFEGSNIRAWIGFKHFLYLVERAVLQWLLDQGHGARELYRDHGLGVEIVDCSALFSAALELDEDVRAEIAARPDGRLTVRLTVLRQGRQVTALRATVSVALIQERTAEVHRPAPPALAHLEAAELSDACAAAGPGRTAEAPGWAEPGGFRWSWRIPYFYCHYSDRMQHSGFVRALEEAFDRFLADRGISIARLLRERSWIPVVSRTRIQLIAPAYMEETLHTVFRVTGVMRGIMFDARMDCYVQRGPDLVHVATAQILHGYMMSAGESAGAPVQLGPDMVEALTGGSA